MPQNQSLWDDSVPKSLNDVPGADAFNAKLKLAQAEQESLSGLYGAANAVERDRRAAALVATCNRLSQERSRLMHETITGPTMVINSLFAKATGPESIRHNKAVADFRARWIEARKKPFAAYMFAARKYSEYADYFSESNRPPPHSDEAMYNVNIAKKRLAAVDASFSAEYKALQAARNLINKKTKGI